MSTVPAHLRSLARDPGGGKVVAGVLLLLHAAVAGAVALVPRTHPPAATIVADLLTAIVLLLGPGRRSWIVVLRSLAALVAAVARARQGRWFDAAAALALGVGLLTLVTDEGVVARRAIGAGLLVASAGLLVTAGLRGRSRPAVIPPWTGRPSVPGDPGPAAPSAGCGARAWPAGPVSYRTRIRGQERSYDVRAPAPARARGPLAVVFFFHGFRQANAPWGGGTGGLAEVEGAADRALFVSPHGAYQPGARGVGWDLWCEGDDMTFFDQMRAEIAERYCVDPGAVFAAGFSWGADMVDALACCRGEHLRAVAPASGGVIGANERCPARRIPAVRTTFSARDPAYEHDVFETSVGFFRAAHGCATGADPVAPAPCRAYRGCARPVIACEYPDDLHRLPRGFAEATWAFFAAQIVER